jgi:hypothetical protein
MCGSVRKWVYILHYLVTPDRALIVIVLGICCQWIVSSLKQNLGGHKFKYDCELETEM